MSGPKELGVSAVSGAGGSVFEQPMGWLDNVPVGKGNNFKVGFSFQVTVDTYDSPSNTVVEQRVLAKFRHVVNGSTIYELRPDNRQPASQFVPQPNPPTEAEWNAYGLFAEAKGGDAKFQKELEIANNTAMRVDQSKPIDLTATHLKVAGNRIQYVDLPGKPGALPRDAKHLRDFRQVGGVFEMKVLINIRAYHVSERAVLPAARKTQLEHSVYVHLYAEPDKAGGPARIKPLQSGTIGFGIQIGR